jgi:hypothetical protein
MTTGRCLCGAVRYEVHGPPREVLICHCDECRRWHGHVSAGTAANREHLVLVEQRGLRWIHSPRSDAQARRGFCVECGSSLFWDAPSRPTVSIAAGTLDGPTGLRIGGHWYGTYPRPATITTLPRTGSHITASAASVSDITMRERYVGRACPLYSGLGSMFVAIAMRFVRLYMAVISATSHASSRVSPASSRVWRSSRVISRGCNVSFSA